jgi:membrane protease YdiL (CAAX protease family)
MASSSSLPTAAASPPLLDRSRVAAWWHTIVFVIGMLMYGALQRHAASRVTGPHARSRVSLYLSTIVFEFVLLGYIWFLGLRPAGKKLRDIIGGKWARFSDFLIDVGVALLFWMVVATFLIVFNLTFGKNNSGMEALKALLPHGPLEMVLWVLLSCTAGFCEETVFRGYLQRQFFALTGMAPVAVIGQALIFGSVHLYQGVKGAVGIACYGVLFGILAISRNSLRPGMIQHAGQDTFSGLIGSILEKHHYI